MIATLSSLLTTNDTFSKIFLPSNDADKFSTVNTSLPSALSISKPTKGYFLDEGTISSRLIFSNDFFLDVACEDLEALALNLAINAFSSLILSSFFLFEASINFWANCDDCFQKS